LYAFVSAALVYLALGVWLIVSDRKQLKRWLLSAGAALILYSPWIAVGLTQFSSVNGNFWIPPVDLVYLTYFAAYPFVFSENLSVKCVVFGIPLAAIFLIVFVKYLRNNRFTAERRALTFFTYSSVMILAGTIAAGCVVSWVFSPLFAARYAFPAMGCWWLAFCLMLMERERIAMPKHFTTIAALMLVLVVAANSVVVSADEIKYSRRHERFMAVLDTMNEDDVIVASYGGLARVCDFLTEHRKIYMIREEPIVEPIRTGEFAVHGVQAVNSFADIPELMRGGGDIFYFVGVEDSEALTQYLENTGMKATRMGVFEYDSLYKFAFWKTEK
jgi:hypothetical protein